MISLLLLDDQPYTVDIFVERARELDFEVEATESVLPFKLKAEQWALEGRTFAAAIDMNLPDIPENDIMELGAQKEEIGTGEAAGLVVARHIFANGHKEPIRSALRAVPVAMISAENLSAETRRDIEELRKLRIAETSYIPKPDNNSRPIPNGASFNDFLAKFRAEHNAGAIEKAILLDVRNLLKLNDQEVMTMLGVTDRSASVECLLSQGTTPPTRDWKDRLHHLSDIVVILSSIYSRSDTKKWLSAPLEILNGKSPRATILTGDLVDLLLIKQIAMDLGNPY